MSTVGILYTLPWVAVYIRYLKGLVCVYGFPRMGLYDMFHAWAFCSCPFLRFWQCEGLRCVKRAKGKNPRILFLMVHKLKSNLF